MQIWIYKIGTIKLKSKIDLSWIDAFWEKIGALVIYREEDDILILPPNRVYKLNETARYFVQLLMSGKKLARLRGLNEEQRGDIDTFFRQIERALQGFQPSCRQISYDFNFTRLPVLGEIAITYACNNRCKFCYAGCSGANARLDTADLLLQDLKCIIDIFKHEAKLPFFSFTGGEPTLRPELDELVAYAGELGLKTNLVSNGRLITKQRAQSLARAGLGSAQISIEGPDAALHDELCAVSGAFEQAVAGVKHLQDAGIAVQSNTTCCKLNQDRVVEMPAFGKSLGFTRMAFNMFIPTERSPANAALFIPYSAMPPIIDGVRKACYEQKIQFLWYSPMPMGIYNSLARGLGNKNCAACDGLLSVDPQGNVLPCSSWDEGVGNLLCEGFEKTWFGARAQHIKQKLCAPVRCRDCMAFVACQGACPLYWAYAGEEELSGCLEAMN
ncbi:MAG: radical SAM protein [Bradymonadales bacterium]